jgi:polysaccharide biosynthesis/export protein
MLNKMRHHPLVTPSALLIPLAFGLVACASSYPYVWVQEVPKPAESELRLTVGDTISVLVKDQEQLSGDFVVRPDGNYLQPKFGNIQVAGKTLLEAEVLVTQSIRGIIVEPRVSIGIGLARPQRIAVVGEVANPGHYEFTDPRGVLDALALAGGITEFAASDGIYVIRRGANPNRIRFRYSDLAGGDTRSIAFRLQDGDIVVVD